MSEALTALPFPDAVRDLHDLTDEFQGGRGQGWA